MRGRAIHTRVACDHARQEKRQTLTSKGLQLTVRCLDCGASAVTWGTNYPILTPTWSTHDGPD